MGGGKEATSMNKKRFIKVRDGQLREILQNETTSLPLKFPICDKYFSAADLGNLKRCRYIFGAFCLLNISRGKYIVSA